MHRVDRTPKNIIEENFFQHFLSVSLFQKVDKRIYVFKGALQSGLASQFNCVSLYFLNQMGK